MLHDIQNWRSFTPRPIGVQSRSSLDHLALRIWNIIMIHFMWEELKFLLPWEEQFSFWGTRGKG